MLERDIEAWLVAEAKRRGGVAIKFTSPQRRAVPDRMVLLPGGKLFFVETKRPGEKPTDPQAREHARLRALGQTVYVMDSKVWPEGETK